jgi:hypothetical protein
MYRRWRDNNLMDREEKSSFWQEAHTKICVRESKEWFARDRNGRD